MIERLRGLRKTLGQGILSRGIFSLVLAFLLWGWVTNLDDPEIERTYTNLPITLVGQHSDLVILDADSLPSVSATMRGPQSALENINNASLRATVDLGEITEPGEHRVAVDVDIPAKPRGVREAATTPGEVTLTLDRLSSKAFALETDIGPAVPPYSIGNVEYQPRQVEVRGPASLVGRVARVILPVGLGDRRESFEAPFTPEARDVNGNRVTGVTISPNSVTAIVAVERVGRTVSIVPNIVGEPPNGYIVRDTSVSPPSVTVDGPPDALAQLIVVPTTPIKLDERRESFSVYDIGLVLPAGIRLIDRAAINVEVRIEAEQQRQPVNVRVATLVDPGLRATLTPTEIVVVLSGPRERVGQLRSDDVKAELDLRGYAPGSYTLVPRVTIPDDLRADPPLPVRVQIDRPATPTLTPTLTPTPPSSPTPTPTIPPTAPPSGRQADLPIARQPSR